MRPILIIFAVIGIYLSLFTKPGREVLLEVIGFTITSVILLLIGGTILCYLDKNK